MTERTSFEMTRVEEENENARHRRIASDISALIERKDWAGIHRLLSGGDVAEGEIVQVLRTSKDDEGSSFVHRLCEFSSVPLDLVQLIVDKIGDDYMTGLSTNDARQTPLHVAVQCIPFRSDLVEWLVAKFKSWVSVENSEFYRPVDYLNFKIIMNEEREQYRHIVERTQSNNGEMIWETVKIMAEALCEDSPDSQNLAHACLRALNFPVALTERAIRRGGYSQLLEADSEGNLPMHVVCSRALDVDSIDFLDELIGKCSAAASVHNFQGKLPLDIVIEKGTRQWSTGIKQLIEAFPAGLQGRKLGLGVYPLLFEKACSEGSLHIVYLILQSKPDIALGAHA